MDGERGEKKKKRIQGQNNSQRDAHEYFVRKLNGNFYQQGYQFQQEKIEKSKYQQEKTGKTCQ